MERRPKFFLRRADGSIDPPTTDRIGTAQVKYLSDFLTYGQITIGQMDPVGSRNRCGRKACLRHAAPS